MMKVTTKTIHIQTSKQFQIFPVTKQVEQVLHESGVKNGICVISTQHSTGGIRLNDNETLLAQDVMKMLYRLVPIDISYGHDNFESRTNIHPDERSNGNAHVKSFLIGSSESVPVANGSLVLGEHQEIFFMEFDGSRPRTIDVTILGE